MKLLKQALGARNVALIKLGAIIFVTLWVIGLLVA